ncbi:MAG TPA: glycoside hydrolase family 3 C-terminal domain-containing protein [Polyangiaceae bacterium]
MSRSVSFVSSATTSAFALALVTACGHSAKTLDAYKLAKSGISPTAVSTAAVCTTSNTGPQFDCTLAGSQQFDTQYMQAYCVSPDVSKEVSTVVGYMDQAGKASQMLGVDTRDFQDIERSPDTTVPGVGTIRGYNYRDAGKGVNLDAGQKNRAHTGGNYATVFPAPSIRAASWDLDLEKRVGEAAGDETAASHNNMLLAPCMNIIRHPYWGRTQETYGEDTYHVGRMATAFTVGLQEYVTGCAKHFAANNIEKDRATQNAIMNEQTLREVFGRHFEMVVQDGGVGCIMASYNEINGTKDTQNQHLLRDILKAPVEQGGFGFQGLVISDWWAMPGYEGDATQGYTIDPQHAQSDTIDAVKAGLDIEVPWTLHYSTTTLAQADQLLIQDAATRVLTQKYRFKTALDTDGWSVKAPTSTLTDDGSIATNMDHEALAEEAEIKSAVLLSNGIAPAPPVLPLTNATNIAVIGPDEAFSLVSSSVPKTCGPTGRSCTFHFATDVALGDRGSSRVNGDPARSVGPFAGIQAAAPTTATVTSGNSVDAATAADTIVLVVGYTPGDEGEEYAIGSGGDRSTLDLPAGQNDLVQSVLDLMKPTVIVVQSGSIVNLPWLTHANQNQATIWAGYGGIRGGSALGKLIFGAANFSGKVPLAWPTQSELDAQANGTPMLPFKEADTATHMGYFFGYREYDRRKYVTSQATDMVFPFGWGMSYSSYEYSNLMLPCQTVTKDAVFNVSVDIKNTSTVDGDEVAMLFVKPPPKPASITGDRAWKELKSFARVHVVAGNTVTAQLPLRVRDLRHWEGDETGRWVIDSGDYTIAVGANADDAESTTNQATLPVTGD